MDKKINVAMVSKLMPFYRLGIFQALTSNEGKYVFHFFGDVVEQAGIKQIPYSYSTAPKGKNIRWVKTKNFFYKPESLLWQTGIVKEIFKLKFKIFVFEGGIRHLPIWLYAILCKLNGKKVFYWTHGNRGLDNNFRKFIRKIFFDCLGDGLLLYGHFQRKLMIEEGYNPDKLFVIYNSLQPEEQFDTLSSLDDTDVALRKNQLFKKPENTTFIFIGRLVAHKGVMNILKALRKLEETNIIANCIFIGEGPQREKMQGYCEKYGLENQVYFTGALYKEEEIATYFYMSDLMVSPGNVGLNCIHSLAYGVPVLTHDDFRYQNPEVESLTEGVTGYFFEHNNMESMHQKLKYFIENNVNKIDSLKKCHETIKLLYNPKNQVACITEAFDKIY